MSVGNQLIKCMNILFVLMFATLGCSQVRIQRMSIVEFHKKWDESNCEQRKSIAASLFNSEYFDNDDPILIVVDGRYGEATSFVVASLRLDSTAASRVIGIDDEGGVPIYSNGLRVKPTHFTIDYKEFARILRDSVKCD